MKYRVVTNGEEYRVQVRHIGLFWNDARVPRGFSDIPAPAVFATRERAVEYIEEDKKTVEWYKKYKRKLKRKWETV